MAFFSRRQRQNVARVPMLIPKHFSSEEAMAAICKILAAECEYSQTLQGEVVKTSIDSTERLVRIAWLLKVLGPKELREAIEFEAGNRLHLSTVVPMAPDEFADLREG